MVVDTLGTDVGASVSDNAKTFKRMTNETGAFTYEGVIVWLKVLSRISEWPGLSACAEEYAQRLAEDDEENKGWLWLDVPQESWCFMKPAHYPRTTRCRNGMGLTEALSNFLS